MVTCKHCDSKNSLDSRFCKSCGKPLEGDAIQKAQSDIEELVAQGFRTFNDGNPDEASLIADSALADDPNSTSALSLKAMCYERAGKIAEALELFEKVLALKPDSALDRVKVTHLRNAIVGKLAAPPPPDRRTAILGAIAATVLVVAVGVALAGFMGKGAPSATNNADVSASNPNQAQIGSQPSGTQQPGGQPSGDPNGTQTPGDSPPPGADGGSGAKVVPTTGTGPFPGVNGNQFPPITINPDDLSNDRGSKEPTKPPANDRPQNKTNEDGPDPRPVRDQNQNGGAAPPKNPGIVDIKISNPQNTSGGSVEVQDGRSADVLARTGLQQYQAGRFQNAARSFEGAIRAGADPGRTNQRLAQCYERLGQSNEAINAYNRAIAAFDAQVRSGKNPNAQAGLDSCKYALQVLKGGS